jgi:hypothetical protein
MVVTEQVQASMHHHVCPVLLLALALLGCFPRDNRCTYHDISQQWVLEICRQVSGEGQHIGGAVATAVLVIEPGHFLLRYQAYADFCIMASVYEGGRNPAVYVLVIHSGCATGTLDVDLEIHGRD